MFTLFKVDVILICLLSLSSPSGLDELGELEAKLSAVYNKLTAKKKKKKRKRHSSGSSDSSSSSGRYLELVFSSGLRFFNDSL